MPGPDNSTCIFCVFIILYCCKGDEGMIDLDENKRMLQELESEVKSIGDSL